MPGGGCLPSPGSHLDVRLRSGSRFQSRDFVGALISLPGGLAGTHRHFPLLRSFEGVAGLLAPLCMLLGKGGRAVKRSRSPPEELRQPARDVGPLTVDGLGGCHRRLFRIAMHS